MTFENYGFISNNEAHSLTLYLLDATEWAEAKNYVYVINISGAECETCVWFSKTLEIDFIKIHNEPIENEIGNESE